MSNDEVRDLENEKVRAFMKETYARVLCCGLEDVVLNGYQYKVVDDDILLIDYIGSPEDEADKREEDKREEDKRDKALQDISLYYSNSLEVPDWFDGVADNETCSSLNIHNLEEIKFSKRVKKIGVSAFENSKKIKSVVAPSVAEIGDRAFYDATSLESVDMPLINKIGRQSFKNCHNLYSLQTQSLKYLGEQALYNTGLTVLKLSELEFAGVACVSDCRKLRCVILPHSKKFKPACEMFVNNYSLEEINLEVLDFIPKCFLFNCVSLKFLEIKARQISVSALVGCVNLRQIRVYGELMEIKPEVLGMKLSPLDHRTITIAEFKKMIKEENKTLYQQYIENLKKGRFLR